MKIKFYNDATLKGLANALVQAGIPRAEAESVLTVLGCANRAAIMAVWEEESVDYPRLDRLEEDAEIPEIRRENVRACVNDLLCSCYVTDDTFAPKNAATTLLGWVGLSYVSPPRRREGVDERASPSD